MNKYGVQVSAIENMLRYLQDELHVTRKRRAEYPVNLFEKFYPSPEQLIERFIMLAEFQIKKQKTKESLTEEDQQRGKNKMTKLKLAKWMVKKYMPSRRFNGREPSYRHHVQTHLEGILKFDFGEWPFEDMVYSPQAFIYFWGKFNEKFSPYPPLIIFRVVDGRHECEIDGRGELSGVGETQIEAFYRAVVALEEEEGH